MATLPLPLLSNNPSRAGSYGSWPALLTLAKSMASAGWAPSSCILTTAAVATDAVVPGGAAAKMIPVDCKTVTISDITMAADVLRDRLASLSADAARMVVAGHRRVCALALLSAMGITVDGVRYHDVGADADPVRVGILENATQSVAQKVPPLAKLQSVLPLFRQGEVAKASSIAKLGFSYGTSQLLEYQLTLVDIHGDDAIVTVASMDRSTAKAVLEKPIPEQRELLGKALPKKPSVLPRPTVQKLAALVSEDCLLRAVLDAIADGDERAARAAIVAMVSMVPEAPEAPEAVNEGTEAGKPKGRRTRTG
jgi:hypothetical protein